MKIPPSSADLFLLQEAGAMYVFCICPNGDGTYRLRQYKGDFVTTLPVAGTSTSLLSREDAFKALEMYLGTRALFLADIESLDDVPLRRFSISKLEKPHVFLYAVSHKHLDHTEEICIPSDIKPGEHLSVTVAHLFQTMGRTVKELSGEDGKGTGLYVLA